MEMLNWMNQDGPGMGPLRPPVMRTAGRPHADLTADGAVGFWCHKPVPGGTFPNPRNRVPYGQGDPHFAIAVVRIPQANAGGTVFQAGTVFQRWHSALAVSGGRAQARWTDVNGQSVVLDGPALAPGVPSVLTLVSAPGRQQLRVNGVVAGSGAAGLAGGPFGDLLIGWGDAPAGNGSTFRGHVFAVVTGRGEPSAAELAVLERYLLG
jgi:endoglucanase